jgi:hypothetical protein
VYKNPKETRLSSRKIAGNFGIPTSTLNDHILKKCLTQKAYLEKHQKLNPQQEKELVIAIQVADSWGMPLKQQDVEQMANDILNRGHKGSKVEVRDGWFECFYIWHQEELASQWSSPLDKKQTDGLNGVTVKQHFDLVEETGREFEIIQELDYGFDESPIMLGIAPKQRVYGHSVNQSGKWTKQSYDR